MDNNKKLTLFRDELNRSFGFRDISVSNEKGRIEFKLVESGHSDVSFNPFGGDGDMIEIACFPTGIICVICMTLGRCPNLSGGCSAFYLA